MSDTDSNFPAANTGAPAFAGNAPVAPAVATPDGSFVSEGDTSKAKASIADAKQQVMDGATKVQQQAVDKIQALAGDGKAKAGSALDQVAQLLNDAAGQVDESWASNMANMRVRRPIRSRPCRARSRTRM
ncbi:hypothetical protein P0F65_08690 [Sphingomonas sp. I4]